MNSSLVQQYSSCEEERSDVSSQSPALRCENHQGTHVSNGEGDQKSAGTTSLPCNIPVFSASPSSSTGISRERIIHESLGDLNRADIVQLPEEGGSFVNMSPPVRELSVGLTFRKTKRGFFLFVNDSEEKVFLDEQNRYHRLDDGFDSEEIEVTHLDYKDTTLRVEVDTKVLISSEAARLKQLESQISQQQQLLDQQYSQYQEYRQRQQQYNQYPQYIQQIEHNYRPAEQQVTETQRKLMSEIQQSVQQNAQSPSLNISVLAERYSSKTPQAIHICNILRQLGEKQRDNYQSACARRIADLLHKSEYPVYQGNMDQVHHQYVENQYREQQQCWSQLIQLIHEELSLLEQLIHVLDNQRVHNLPEAHPTQHGSSREQLKSQQMLQNPLPVVEERTSVDHEVPPSSHQRLPLSNQKSSALSTALTQVKFSGHFDPERRPLYSDSAGNYFRYNAQRQLEKVSIEESTSLHLS